MLPESDLARPRTATNDEKLTPGACRPKNAQSKPPADHQALKCPRCDSPNTKFCYYNNYSLTQPRHFCKTCRRYWTKGGALRNVPVGGGCRKNKKVKSSSLRLPSSDDSGSSNPEIGRLGFFNSLSSVQLGGNLPFSAVVHNAPATGLYDQLGVFSLEQSRSSNSFVSSTGTGFNSLNVDTSLASSIESLSSINQDLHWKLQQQRLAMMFGSGDNNTAVNKNRGISSPIALEDHSQELNPGSFRNLEISKPEACKSSDFNNARKEIVAGGDSAAADEWFFGDSYASTSMTVTTAGAAAAGYNSGDSAAGCDGVQEWHDLHQYSHLP